jgi:hypothetical protein
MAISGTWKATYIIPDAYTGAGRWGTGIDPVHAIRDEFHKPTGTKIPLGSTASSDAPPVEIVDEGDYGYCTGDYIGGVHDYREITEDHPGTDRTPGGHADREHIPGNYPSWGPWNDDNLVDGFPITGPPGGTDFLGVQHASGMELSHANATPFSYQGKGVAGGWVNKQRGEQLEAKTSDPVQYEINTSMHQAHGVMRNTRATARYFPGIGGDEMRSPIESRTAGVKVKHYADDRVDDMFPVQQDLPFRPFWYRSAAVPPDPGHLAMNTMEGRAAMQRTVNPDPYQGDYASQNVDASDNYGYSSEDVTY